jgi:alkylation response protein AidB-like acyl-CoA dehydrogenase
MRLGNRTWAFKVDLSFSEQDRTFQQEIRAWLDTAWPTEMREKLARSALARLSRDDIVRWQKSLAARGWAAPNWPAEYGGAGFTPSQK